jgi:hypothetical protein
VILGINKYQGKPEWIDMCRKGGYNKVVTD